MNAYIRFTQLSIELTKNNENQSHSSKFGPRNITNHNVDIKKSFNTVYRIPHHKPRLTKYRLLAISEVIYIRLLDSELCSHGWRHPLTDLSVTLVEARVRLCQRSPQLACTAPTVVLATYLMSGVNPKKLDQEESGGGGSHITIM